MMHSPSLNDNELPLNDNEAMAEIQLLRKRYVAPIELFLKKAGLTSSIATFPGDGEGRCFVSDLPAEQVVTNLAAVGIPAKVVEH